MQPLNQNSTLSRINSVDFIRGLVMVLMAIDHVRVYSGLPSGGQEAGIFFTRWITHFCAPAFVFLSGTSAYLYGFKLNDTKKLANYLLTRGLLLVVLELTLIRFFWTFNLNYGEFTLAGVIWMLGWCMIIMALLVRLKPLTIGIAGLLIIFLQDIFSLVPNFLPATLDTYWEFIYSSGNEGPSFMTILYVIVPWIGVMMAGYGFGIILQMDAERRKKLLIGIGLSATLLFVVIGSIVVLMNQNDDSRPFIFSLLNQRKYPASQLYLLMTLGPCILLMPFVEKAESAFSKAINIFGRVPFFYYLLHIPLIHISALIVNMIQEGEMHQEWYNNAPYVWFEPEHHWSLGLLYIVFAMNVVILYFACKWYERYKFKHPEKKWLKFV
jgi:uncharacterized membrane protein